MSTSSADGRASSHSGLDLYFETDCGPATTEQIIEAFSAIWSHEQGGTLSLDRSALLISELARRTELPEVALSASMDTFRRVMALCRARDEVMLLSHSIMVDTFLYGSLLWRDPDGALWQFAERHWTPIGTDRLKQIVSDTILSSVNLARLHSRSLLREIVDHIMMVSLRPTALANVATVAQQPVLNVRNGEIWLYGDTVELRPHRPWTGQTIFTDIDYDPSAQAPVYDTALSDIFSSSSDPAAMIRHWHEFAGYAIQLSRPIPSFWLLIGKGANGKSRLLDIIRKLVGPQGVLAEPISRFQNDRFALSSLSGKKLLIDDDVDEDLILSDGLIKKLSEEKAVTARSPYGRRKQEFMSIALPVMAGNHYPTTKDISPGMQRRTFVIPFERTFSTDEQQPHLFEQIWQAERSGVLNHALAGFLRVVDRGFKFDEPQDCVEARSRFFVESNPLRAFISERCETDMNAKIKLAILRAAFQSWAQENAIPASSLGGNKLKRNLELLGFEIAKMKGYPYVRGLAIKNENEFA